MPNQVTLNASFFRKLEQIEDDLEEKVVERLTDIASAAVQMSPVDTGAYVTSFSILPRGAGGGRGRTSNNKPRGISAEAAKQEAMAQLTSDISKLDAGNIEKFVLRNRSPHSRSVEDGGPNWRRSGYGIFRRIKSLFG